jgi:hypothetical protein
MQEGPSVFLPAGQFVLTKSEQPEEYKICIHWVPRLHGVLGLEPRLPCCQAPPYTVEAATSIT